MRVEGKSAAILLATLALGVVLGMVGQGLLMRERTERVGELRRPRGFVAQMEDVIQPRADQQPAVRNILEATGWRNATTIGAARNQLRFTLDSMRLQLAPILDGEQRGRLERAARLPDPFRPPPPPPRDGRGPPRDGPPRDGPRDGPPEQGGPPDGPPPGSVSDRPASTR